MKNQGMDEGWENRWRIREWMKDQGINEGSGNQGSEDRFRLNEWWAKKRMDTNDIER